MTNNTQSNISRAVIIGRQAGRDMLNETKNSESGMARATLSIVYAIRDELTFSAVIPGKDGAIGEAHPFNFTDFAKEPKKADGKRDTVMVSARYTAIAQDLFGIAEADNAVTQRIRVAHSMASFIEAQLARLDDAQAEEAVPLVDLVTRKRARHGETVQIAFLQVPQFILFDEDDKALKLNEQQRAFLKRSRLFPVELDGSTMPGIPVKQSLRALSQRADIASGKRTAQQRQQDVGAQLTASLALLDQLTRQWTSEEGEAEVALSKHRRVDLFIMQVRLARMFAADPLTDEETAEMNRRSADNAKDKKAA